MALIPSLLNRPTPCENCADRPKSDVTIAMVAATAGRKIQIPDEGFGVLIAPRYITSSFPPLWLPFQCSRVTKMAEWQDGKMARWQDDNQVRENERETMPSSIVSFPDVFFHKGH